jgi:hypothetical protein
MTSIVVRMQFSLVWSKVSDFFSWSISVLSPAVDSHPDFVSVPLPPEAARFRCCAKDRFFSAPSFSPARFVPSLPACFSAACLSVPPQGLPPAPIFLWIPRRARRREFLQLLLGCSARLCFPAPGFVFCRRVILLSTPSASFPANSFTFSLLCASSSRKVGQAWVSAPVYCSVRRPRPFSVLKATILVLLPQDSICALGFSLGIFLSPPWSRFRSPQQISAGRCSGPVWIFGRTVPPVGSGSVRREIAPERPAVCVSAVFLSLQRAGLFWPFRPSASFPAAS